MKKTPEQKAQEKLAKLLGIAPPTEVSRQEAHDRSMEAEAVLEYYDNPRSFSEKNCKQCGHSFATRGAPVAYCSDPCRVKAFEKRMGVTWKPLRSPEQRWGFLGEPLTVPHDALIVAQHVMAEQAALTERDNYGTAVDPPEIAPVDEVNVLDMLADMGL